MEPWETSLRGSGDAEAVSGGAGVDGPHRQQRRSSRPAAGRWLRESSHPPAAVWVSDVTWGHHSGRWKKDGRVSPESESRFTATCSATGKD